MEISSHNKQAAHQENPYLVSVEKGFALISTLMILSLLVVVALAMLSLSSVETRSQNDLKAINQAKSNARMALMIALGELQNAAGPDQRVTATASVLGSPSNPYTSGTTAVDGRKHWLGVWNTSDYSPADPDNKTFVRWLVSGQDAGVSLNDLSEAGNAPGGDALVIFEGVDTNGDPDPDGPGSVKVPKVEINTGNRSRNRSYYAYWVEDQGVKADLAWNEVPEESPSDTDKARAQARRLAVAPGPDHELFGGPFLDKVNHPLEKGKITNKWLDELGKAHSAADMPLVMEDRLA